MRGFRCSWRAWWHPGSQGCPALLSAVQQMSAPHWQVAASWALLLSFVLCNTLQHLLSCCRGVLPATRVSLQKHPELQLFCNDWTYVRYLRARWVWRRLARSGSSRPDQQLIAAQSTPRPAYRSHRPATQPPSHIQRSRKGGRQQQLKPPGQGWAWWCPKLRSIRLLGPPLLPAHTRNTRQWLWSGLLTVRTCCSCCCPCCRSWDLHKAHKMLAATLQW